jgi:hypothetical protein
MHLPKTVRLPIPEDACELARWLISGDLVDADDVLEFMRGDVVCLRGTAQAFALRRVKHNNQGTPYHALLTEQERRSAGLPVRLNDDPEGE